MASGIFAVLDDIALLMDDVAVASKMAAKKTAGILGDDLAVNAEKATGFLASRELPVLWMITKGSFLNKLIIIPIVFLLKAAIPPAIDILLIAGGFYLAYEGMEKIIEWLFHRGKRSAAEVIGEQEQDLETAEKKKVRSAIVTDFILSAEIIIIALGTVSDSELSVQILTVSVIALLATVGVYGVVALIVRMDDAGYRLIKYSGEKGFLNTLGQALVKALPIVIRILSVVGTIALILVSGGIFSHNVPALHSLLPALPSLLRDVIFGITAGLLAVLIISGIKSLRKPAVKA